MSRSIAVVFGSNGAVGSAISNWFIHNGFDLISVSRHSKHTTQQLETKHIIFNPESPDVGFEELEPETVKAVVWAQGANLNDNIHNFDLTAHRTIYDANVTYILLSLKLMLTRNLFAPKAKLCVISSIWQNLARQNKLSYCITKSAIQGLVQSIAIDLGASGILVNAVLPGALDTPMTRANLDSMQISRLEQLTPLGSLPSLDDVANLVGFLCSDNNSGITGQFIAADRGFSNARII